MRWWLGISVFVALASAFAQLGSPPAQDPVTLRTTTTLVQVNVVAHDADGKAVTDLKQEEFEVLDAGKPQTIATFQVDRLQAGRDPAAVTPPSARAIPGVFSNDLNAEPTRRGYAVLLVDIYNSGSRVASRGRQFAADALSKLDPSLGVGVYSFDRSGVHVLAEAGSDRSTALKKLGSLAGSPAPHYQPSLDGLPDAMDAESQATKIPDGGSDARNSPVLEPDMESYLSNQRIDYSLAALESVAGHLAGLPGRKALVWISSGFPLAVRIRPPAAQLFPGSCSGYTLHTEDVSRVLRALNRADVALYPVDPRAVTVQSMLSAEDTGDCTKMVDNFTWPTMDTVAERTGGVPFYGRNDLDVGIQSAIEDAQASYTLGFYVFKETGPAAFRKLTVRSRRPGVTLRYKEGYFAESERGLTASERRAAAAAALTRVVDATAVPIEATAKRTGSDVKLVIALRPDRLALTRSGERWKGAVSLAIRFAKEDGSQTGAGASRRIEFNLSQATYELGKPNGLAYSKVLPIPKDAASIRVLAQNEATGEIGTLKIPLAEVQAQ
jgi:VWFA-related protein